MNMEPIILWPKITPKEIWDDCNEWVNEKGGLSDKNPSQMMAAAGADPGVCSCPNCHETHWRYGIIHKCPSCKFIYPTDWWPMYSYGVQASKRQHLTDESSVRIKEKIDSKRSIHSYWIHGFNNPVEDPWEEHNKIEWKKVIGDCFISGGELSDAKDFRELIYNPTPVEKSEVPSDSFMNAQKKDGR